VKETKTSPATSTSTSQKRKITKTNKDVNTTSNIVENIMNDKGIMVRDVIVPRLLDPKHKYMKIISWNVTGGVPFTNTAVPLEPFLVTELDQKLVYLTLAC